MYQIIVQSDNEKDLKQFTEMIADSVAKRFAYQNPNFVGELSNKVANSLKEDLMARKVIDEKVDRIIEGVERSITSRAHNKYTREENRIFAGIPTSQPRVVNVPDFVPVPPNRVAEVPKGDEARHLRDNIIATLIGYQNGIGNDESSPEYQAYQKVLTMIESQYGEFMSYPNTQKK